MKNTILNHLHKGTIDADSVAEFLEDLYKDVVNHQEYECMFGISDVGTESVKHVLSSECKRKNMYANSVSFESLKNIKTDNKTVWMMHALIAPVTMKLYYINSAEESRSALKTMIKSASQKQLDAMSLAFEQADEGDDLPIE